MDLKELHVYRLKVGLPAHPWGVSSSNFDTKWGIIQRGSDIYLDHVNDGLAAFGLFGKDCKGLYVRFPEEYADDYLEPVMDAEGKHAVIS